MKKFYSYAQFGISVVVFPLLSIFFIYSVGATILLGEWHLLLWSAVGLFIAVAVQIALGLLIEA